MGLQFKMEHKIIDKLKKVGATSIENAVTCEEAHLNPQEKYWLGYFAGIFLGKIKKTKSHKYYVS
jgi:hypothetical protein